MADLATPKKDDGDLIHGQHAVALEILEALGLDANDGITAVAFRVTGTGYATVTIQRYVKADDGSALAKVLERYRLVPKDG